MTENKLDITQAQEWVDKLASIQNVTRNDIVDWANGAPLISLDQYKTAPLYFYGDITLDKAITSILHEGATEPAIDDIYSVISKHYIAPVIDVPSSELSISDIPADHESQPADWNTFIKEAVDKQDLSNIIGKNVVNTPRIGDTVTVDKYHQAHAVDARLDSQNAVNFSEQKLDMKALADRDAVLIEAGFRTGMYGDNDEQFWLSNGPLTYIISKNPINDNNEYYCELNDYRAFRCTDPLALVKEDIALQPSDFQKNELLKQNFANATEITEDIVLDQMENGVPVEKLQDEFTMVQLANLMNLFKNDLLYMHHHAIGDDFDTIHRITQNLYEQAGEQVDVLSEMAMRLNENINNMSDSQALINGNIYTPITEGDVDIDRMEDELNRKGEIILGALKRCRDYGSEVMSKLDELIYTWATEIEYKNEARRKHFANTDDEEPVNQVELVSRIQKAVTAIVDDLCDQYNELLVNASMLTDRYDSLVKKDQALRKLRDTLNNGPVAKDTSDIDNKIRLVNEELDEILHDLGENLQYQKEFDDVKYCQTIGQYRKELSELMEQQAEIKEPAPEVQQNFAASVPLDKKVADLNEAEIRILMKDHGINEVENKYSDPLMNAEYNARKDSAQAAADARYKAKSANELMHLKLIADRADEERKRQLQDLFLDEDRRREENKKIWDKKTNNKIRHDFIEEDIADENLQDELRYQHKVDMLDRETQYQIAKDHIMNRQANLDSFKRTASDGLVDIILSDLPNDKVMSAYDQLLGKKLIKSNQYLDNAFYNGLGWALRHKDDIGKIAKAGLALSFSNTRKIDRDINRVAERLLSIGFSVQQIEPVITGKFFARLPEECLDLDGMTRDALCYLTGSVKKSRRLFSRLKSDTYMPNGNKRNFSNENFDTVNLHSMPARYKYSINNPRYNYDESCWSAGDSDEDE